MGSVLLIICCGIVSYLTNTILIGLAFGVFVLYLKKELPNKLQFILLIFIFVLIDIYWIPVVNYLNITITIGNKSVADFFNVKPNMPLSNIFSFGIFDLIIYAIQASIAQWIAFRFVVNKFKQPANQSLQRT